MFTRPGNGCHSATACNPRHRCIGHHRRSSQSTCWDLVHLTVGKNKHGWDIPWYPVFEWIHIPFNLIKHSELENPHINGGVLMGSSMKEWDHLDLWVNHTGSCKFRDPDMSRVLPDMSQKSPSKLHLIYLHTLSYTCSLKRLLDVTSTYPGYGAIVITTAQWRMKYPAGLESKHLAEKSSTMGSGSSTFLHGSGAQTVSEHLRGRNHRCIKKGLIYNLF